VTRSIKGQVELAAIDSMILAFGQLLQPVRPMEIFNFAKGTLLKEVLTKSDFGKHFKKLEREGFFWRTSDNRYVVTPRGDILAKRSLDYKVRDKLRFLILNKKRYLS